MADSSEPMRTPDDEITPPSVGLRTDVAHSARVYDYVLGGKDNYPADRELAEELLSGWPGMRTGMRANRSFMHRAGRYLVEAAGIRQFLDIGTGIPTSPNLHEVVQSIAPESRVVYVDNDPIVLVHAQALLTSTPEGRTDYIHADLGDPQSIINAPQLAKTLDLGKPVALSIIALLQFVPDDQDPRGIISRLMEPLASGSYLALTVMSDESNPEQMAKLVREYTSRGIPTVCRTKQEAEQFFTGLELVEPGVRYVHQWRPEDGREKPIDPDVGMLAGVARKP